MKPPAPRRTRTILPSAIARACRRSRPAKHARLHHGRLSAFAALLLLVTFVPGAAPASADAGTWTVTGSMTTPRYAHTATLLPDGQVLVAGGDDSASITASAELYNPSTGTWSVTGSMSTTRAYHTATLLLNGQVLVAGGDDNSTGYTASAELYNPSTGTWSVTGSMTTPRLEPTATLLPNGDVLVAGGYYGGPLASAELYDPSTGTWTATGSMTTPRYLHTATLLPNGNVLVTGGYNTGGSNTTASAELYDPNTGTWTTTGSMSTPRGEHSATLLSNGKVLVAGGITSGINCNIDPCIDQSSAELYVPSTGTWTATGSLTTVRYGHTATLLPSGQVLVVGGGINNSYTASAELYDPSTGTWMTTGSMATARINHTSTLLPDGRVLVAGGLSNISYAASAELYSQDTTPPTTTATLSPSANGAGWNNSPVSVTLSAVDNPGGSGVATTYYAIDNAACAPGNASNCTVYGGPFSVSNEGQHTLYFFSMDNAGNAETQQSVPVSIDETPPQTSLSVSGTATGCGSDFAPVTATLAAQDNLSGVAATTDMLDGGSQQPYSVPIPLTAPGAHALTYASSDVAGNVEPTQASTITLVSPTLAGSRGAGSYGTTVALTGGNFMAGEPMSVYWDSTTSTPLVTATAGAGCAANATISVPQAVAGAHTLIAVGQSSGQAAGLPFTVKPKTTLLTGIGHQSKRVTMTGYGFGADEQVTAHWASPSGPTLGHITTNGRGSFTGLAFTVPMSPTGIYPVYAVGQTNHASAVSLFAITPFLSIAPTSGAAGSHATVGATGFGAREMVTVKWDCAGRSCAGSTVLAVATTNADGDVSKVGVIVPASAGVGTHTIGAIGKSSRAFATTRYTVTP